MSEQVKSIFKVASIYMTTIIGAGFASGQEIVLFFSSYYSGGFYGIIMAGILFAVIGCMVLGRVYKERIRNYDEFLYPLVGYLPGRIMETAVMLFMFSVFCIMVTGLVYILVSGIGIPFIAAALTVAGLCIPFMLTGIRGVAVLSAATAPLLIFGIVAAGLYIMTGRDVPVFNPTDYFNRLTHNWFFSSLLYVSYNSMTSVIIMCNLLPYLKTRKVAVTGGVLGGLLMCAVALILNSAIYMFYPGMTSKELPVLGIMEKYGITLKSLYTFILWIAMFVSAVNSGYCALDRIKKLAGINTRFLAVIMCILSIPLSTLGFSSLLNAIYPVFGYIGLFLVAAILIRGLCSRCRNIGVRKNI